MQTKMSIKTIGNDVQSSSAGVQKRINKSAEKLVFDVLQSTQYSTPIASTVRELVTNACDSQREKEIALEILSGEKEVKDYFITRNEEEYRDSNFDPSYYDRTALSNVDSITVRYTERDGTGYCDTFSVLDYGVGIGQSRLEGYLELGFSTKRNTSENFGAFGLGAKVPLSTGVDFYTVETIHNGKLFKMNCFAYKTDFLINKFTADGFITFNGGTKIYYQNTNSDNRTKISFGSKRHNRDKFKQAIQDQLNYLPNVKFMYVYEDGKEHDRSVSSNVLYNSDNLIVSDSWGWSRPHILMVKDPSATTGINYGFVDFRELEMEALWGAVAIKCPTRQAYTDTDNGSEILLQDGVDVTPSREKVIWNENTKAFIQGAIERAAQDAADVIDGQLNEKDFMTWIKKCRDVLYKGGNQDSALKALGQIVDKEKIKPKFPYDKTIQYASPIGILKGFKVRNVSKVFKNGGYKIEREEVGWGSVNFNNLYFIEGNPSKTKDLYLMKGETLSIITEHHPENPNNDIKVQAYIDNVNLMRVRNWALMKDSPMVKWDYDEIEVPEDFEAGILHDEEIRAQHGKFENLTPAERRQLTGEQVLFTLRRADSGDNKYANQVDDWVWDKVEAPLNLLQQTSVETYYGTSEDVDLLYLAATICAPNVPDWNGVYPEVDYWHKNRNAHASVRNQNPVFTNFKPQRFFNDYYGKWADGMGEDKTAQKETPIQLYKVSGKMAKQLDGSNAKHISTFFSIVENNKWTMNERVREWFTGCMLPKIPDWVFSLKEVDPQYEDVFTKCMEYQNKYNNHDDLYFHRGNEKNQEVISLMKKMHDMQVFLLDNDDPEAIKNKSLEVFKVSDIQSTIMDEDMLILGNYLEEFLEPLRPLFDQVDFTDSQEFWKEISSYLEMKNRHKFNPPL